MEGYTIDMFALLRMILAFFMKINMELVQIVLKDDTAL